MARSFLLLVAGASAGCTLADEADPTLSMRTLDAAIRQDAGPARDVIDSREGWTQWWATYSAAGHWNESGSWVEERSSLPAVDFSKELVVAVMTGPAGSTCSRIRVTEADWADERITLTVHTYSEGRVCAQTATNAYHVIALQPRAEITFREFSAARA